MRYYKLIGVLGLFLFIGGCTKNTENNEIIDNQTIDKRTEFIGDYEFTIRITCTPNLGNCDTTYTYAGNIDYSSDKDKVKVQFESNYSIEPQVGNNNSLIQHIDNYQDDTLGRFLNKDEIEFTIRSGGLGGGYYRNVYGLKK
jgi:hypothetical protein